MFCFSIWLLIACICNFVKIHQAMYHGSISAFVRAYWFIHKQVGLDAKLSPPTHESECTLTSETTTVMMRTAVFQLSTFQSAGTFPFVARTYCPELNDIQADRSDSCCVSDWKAILYRLQHFFDVLAVHELQSVQLFTTGGRCHCAGSSSSRECYLRLKKMCSHLVPSVPRQPTLVLDHGRVPKESYGLHSERLAEQGLASGAVGLVSKLTLSELSLIVQGSLQTKS